MTQANVLFDISVTDKTVKLSQILKQTNGPQGRKRKLRTDNRNFNDGQNERTTGS
jgi:hypothetical protein